MVTTIEQSIFQSNYSIIHYGADANGITTAPGDGEPCSIFYIKCDSASTATLRVRIPGIHAAGQYAFLKAGEDRPFKLKQGTAGGIHRVHVSTASGTATFNYTVVE